MLWPKKIHARNLVTKKYSCGSKIPFPRPPHNFSNGPSLTECGRQRSEVKKLSLHRCALRKFHVTYSQNTRDQIYTNGTKSKRA